MNLSIFMYYDFYIVFTLSIYYKHQIKLKIIKNKKLKQFVKIKGKKNLVKHNMINEALKIHLNVNYKSRIV